MQLKAALRGLDYEAQVQMLAPEGPETGGSSVHTAAAKGISGSASRLPHASTIQNSFEGYDISNVQAHLDPAAHAGATAMGAEAYATGDHIAFAKASPDLQTAAHEATHVIQQKAGVSLSGGVGKPGDAYERQADDVAALVVQGKSAAGLLGEISGGASSGNDVQMREDPTLRSPADEGKGGEALDDHKDAPQRDDPSVERAPELASTREPEQAAVPEQAEQFSGSQKAAVLALDSLNDAMSDYVFAHFSWLLTNTTSFVGATGGDCAIDYGVDAVTKKAVGLTGASIKAGGRAVGGKVAEAIVPTSLANRIKPGSIAAGTGKKLTAIKPNAIKELSTGMKAVSLFTKVITSSLVSVVWGLVEKHFEDAKINKIVDAATAKMADAVTASIQGAQASHETYLAAWRSEKAGLLETVLNSKSTVELTSMSETLRSNALAVTTDAEKLKADKTLFGDMLHAWLMQKAADDESGGKDVNSETYAKAKETALGPDGPEVSDRGQRYDPEQIFVEQCRYEWSKLGVDATEALASLTRMYENPEPASARKPKISTPLDAVMAVAGPMLEKATTQEDYQPKSTRFGPVKNMSFRFNDVKGHDKMLSYLADINEISDDSAQKPDSQYDHLTGSTSIREKRIFWAVIQRGVVIDCEVDFDLSNGVPSVSSFKYLAQFRDDTGGQAVAHFTAKP